MPVHDSFPPAKTRVVTKEGGKKRSLGVRTRKDEKRDIKGRVVEDHWTLRWGKERKKMNVAFSTLERWRGDSSPFRVYQSKEWNDFWTRRRCRSYSLLFASNVVGGFVNLCGCVNSSGIQMDNDE